MEAAPIVTIDQIDGTGFINHANASAGVTISGTASDSSIGLYHHSITVDLVNSSGVTVDSYTGTIQADGTWRVLVDQSDALGLSDGSYTVTANVTDAAVNPITQTTQPVIVDEDQDEQPTVTVDGGGATTPIGHAGASAVAFAVGGIDTDDSGTLTFTDASHNTVTVTITNGVAVAGDHNTTTAVDLSSLADGSITSHLALTDTAGNSFSADGNAVTLDQDSDEQPTITVDGGGATTPIGHAGASAVAFAVGGIDTDDSGTLTFTDASHNTVTVTITNGVAVAGDHSTTTAVDLSSLADGSITSHLALTDTAGNSFSADGNAVTLDQDSDEQPTITVDGGGATTPIGHAGAAAVAFAVTGIDTDDSGTLTFTDGANHSVTVTITDGAVVAGDHNTTTTVDLSSLADGSITSSLTLNDTAGNNFNASGNAVTLDQDTDEQPAVTVDGGALTPIGHAGAAAVAFAVTGIDTDDSGTLTFTDGANHSVTVTITDGAVVAGDHNTTTTVDLSSLADGSITSSLTLNDTAGNSFSAGGNPVTLGPTTAPTVALLSGFDGQTLAVGPVPSAESQDGVTLAGQVTWNGHAHDGDSQVLFYNGNTSTSGFGLLGQVGTDGKLDLQILAGGVAGLDTGVEIAAGEPHTIALTWADDQFDLYVDGISKYTWTQGFHPISSDPDATYMMVGGAADRHSANFGAQGFNGTVANVSVWNTALTQDQIQATDFTALTGSETDLAAYYKLNDGGATPLSDLVDSAGNLALSRQIPPDNLPNLVFPHLTITDPGTTLDDATVSWSNVASGTIVAFEGLTFDSHGTNLTDGITITYDAADHQYQLTGTALIAAYEGLLNRLTFQSSRDQTPTFTVVVNNGSASSAPVTETVDVFVPASWDRWTGAVGNGNWNDARQLESPCGAGSVGRRLCRHHRRLGFDDLLRPGRERRKRARSLRRCGYRDRRDHPREPGNADGYRRAVQWRQYLAGTGRHARPDWNRRECRDDHRRSCFRARRGIGYRRSGHPGGRRYGHAGWDRRYDHRHPR